MVRCLRCAWRPVRAHTTPPTHSSGSAAGAPLHPQIASRTHAVLCAQGGGGMGNPFGDMGKLMESVKKAQQMVQVETQRVQQELEK